MSNVIPSKLHRVKIFESQDVFDLSSGKSVYLADESTASLERQIEIWINEERALVVNTSMVNIETVKDFDRIVERRNISLVYVPPVEQQRDGIYGQQRPSEVAEVHRPSTTPSAGTTRRVSDGFTGGRRKLRIRVPSSAIPSPGAADVGGDGVAGGGGDAGGPQA